MPELGEPRLLPPPGLCDEPDQVLIRHLRSATVVIVGALVLPGLATDLSEELPPAAGRLPVARPAYPRIELPSDAAARNDDTPVEPPWSTLVRSWRNPGEAPSLATEGPSAAPVTRRAGSLAVAP